MKILNSKKGQQVWGIIALIILFLAVALLFVRFDLFPESRAIDDANSFFLLFEAYLDGDMDLFYHHLNSAMTFLGLFIMLFLILFFVLSNSLKKVFSKKISMLLAFFISIYAFTNHYIYNIILKVSTYMIAFIVFIAVLLIIWGGIGSISPTMDKIKK